MGDQFNGREVNVQGLEVTSRWEAATLLEADFTLPLGLVYTLTDAEFQRSFESDYEPWGDVFAGDKLPYVADQQLTLNASVETNRWGADLSANYVSDARARAGQGPIRAAQLIEARWVADAAIWIDLTDRIRVRVKAENFFDDVYAASIDPAGLRPGKPFEFLMCVELSF